MKRLLFYSAISAIIMFAFSSCEEDAKYVPAEEPVYENLLLTSNSLEFGFREQSKEITVITKSEHVEVSADQPWCRATLKPTADGGRAVLVSVDANGIANRTATVTVQAYGITKTIEVSQEVVAPFEFTQGWAYTIKALDGNWEYPGGDYTRYFKFSDDVTMLTTLSYFGPASGNSYKTDWDIEDNGNYTLIIKLKNKLSITGIHELDVDWATQSLIDEEGPIEDNESYYDSNTNEIYLIYSVPGWGWYFRERAYNRR